MSDFEFSGSRGTNLSKTAEFNRSVILDAIRRLNGKSTRVDLARITGLSSQTISNICNRLIEEGFVREAGKLSDGKGKPRTQIELISQSRFSIGVHIDPSVISIVVVDFEGSLIERVEFEPAPFSAPEKTVTKIAAEVNKLIPKSGVDNSKVLGIGIAAPGPIHDSQGVVLDPPNLLGWHRVPLRDELSKLTGLPVILEKDATAAAVGELWSDTNETGKDFLFVYMGIGIGLGIVISGEVYRGSSGNAGEIGSLKIADSSRRGKRKISGNLGSLLEPLSIVREAEESSILSLSRMGDSPKDIRRQFEDLQHLAKSGNAGAVDLFSRAARNLANATGVMLEILDIDRVIFGGPFWSQLESFYMPELSELISENLNSQTFERIQISSSASSTNVAAVGAACLVLDKTFAPRSERLIF